MIMILCASHHKHLTARRELKTFNLSKSVRKLLRKIPLLSNLMSKIGFAITLASHQTQ
jgi:hypothetical protein